MVLNQIISVYVIRKVHPQQEKRCTENPHLNHIFTKLTELIYYKHNLLIATIVLVCRQEPEGSCLLFSQLYGKG